MLELFGTSIPSGARIGTWQKHYGNHQRWILRSDRDKDGLSLLFAQFSRSHSFIPSLHAGIIDKYAFIALETSPLVHFAISVAKVNGKLEGFCNHMGATRTRYSLLVQR